MRNGDKTIREEILKDITAKDYTVIGITLTCSEETLHERHKKRGDANEELRSAIEQNIKYYNEYRIKEKLGWMSPVQYRLSRLSA